MKTLDRGTFACDRSIPVCAGGQAKGHVLADLHVLELTMLTWRPAPALQPPMPPRCRHSLAVSPVPPAEGRSAAAAVDAAQTPAPAHPEAAPAELALDASAMGVSSLQISDSVANGSSGSAAGGASASNGASDANGATPAEAAGGQQQQEAWLYGGFDGSKTCGELFRFLLPASLGGEVDAAAAGDAQVSRA